MTNVYEIAEKLQQPTVDALHAFYRAMPKRAFGATTQCTDACLIANALAEPVGPGIEVQVSPDGSEFRNMITLTACEDEGDWTDVRLDPILNRLAIFFDGFVTYGKQVNVTAGACARIIERFAKREGIAL